MLLVHYNEDLPLVLACDASPQGIGAVLSHIMPDGAEKPIAYASRTLTKAEKNYSQLEKEGLAVVFGVKNIMLIIGADNSKLNLITSHYQVFLEN